MMKKNKIISAGKLLCFFVIFVGLFFAVQWIFLQKGNKAYCFRERFESYSRSAKNGEEIDVILLGSSPVYTGASPIVVYEETGITSMSLAREVHDPMSEYYLLKSAIEIHCPKVVVLDLSSMTARKTSSYPVDAVYLYTLDNLPDWRIRMEMLSSVLEENEGENCLELMLPLLRNHTRWQELTELDYSKKADYYREYCKGWLLISRVKKAENPSYITEEQLAQETEIAGSDPYCVKWYEKILELCKENDIQVLAVTMPYAYSSGRGARYKALQDFCEKRNIPYLNYATKEQMERPRINNRGDYYDEGRHLNDHGAVKLSKVLAQDIQALFSLEDRRGDPKYAEWDTEWGTFYTEHRELADEVYFGLTDGRE